MNDTQADPIAKAPNGIQQLLSRPIEQATLDDNALALAQERPQSISEEETILLFRNGGERFALPAGSVMNVFPSCKVRKIPHRTRPPFLGLCCHEGSILLTGLLHVVLDMPASEGADPKLKRMIVIGSEESSWTFEVDAVDSIRRVDPSQFRPAPTTIPRNAPSCTTCLIPLEDGSAVLLNPEAIHSILDRAIQ